MAKAIGSTRSTDTNLKGAALRSSSGSGMTFTPAKGLGASMVNDLDNVVARANRQYAADRRAAARERLMDKIDAALALWYYPHSLPTANTVSNLQTVPIV